MRQHGPTNSFRHHDGGTFRDGCWFVPLVKFHADDFADAVFFHRHAVECVGHADGAFVVRDDDEL